MYVIVNKSGKYWNAGVCDRDNIADATQFQNSERMTVKLYSGERWEKL